MTLIRLRSSALSRFFALLLVVANTFVPVLASAQEAAEVPPAPTPVEISEPVAPEPTPEPAPPAPDTPTDPAPTTDPADTTPAETPLDPAPALSETDPAAPLTTDTPVDAESAISPEGDGSQMAAMSGGGTTPPTIPAPNVLSIQNAQPKVDANTGALTFRIPLDIPPGRNGMQPDLALVYNSQSTQDGIAGYGWELSIPHITRINKTGSQNLYSAGFFSSSLDGELATTSTSTSSPPLYRGRIDESRRTYSFASNTWTVYDTNGTRYLFGSASQSQLAATTSPSTIYRWYLDEIRDTNDNYVRFTYTRDGNQLYPSQIIYTGSGSTDGIFTVDFTYASRPDPFIDYRPGFRITTSNRLTQVTAKMSGSTLRQYMLAYQSGNNGTRSLLQSIQQSGNGDTSTTLPSLSFSYVASSLRFVRPAPNATYPLRGSSWIPADVDGNGVNDVTVMWQNVTNSTNYTDLYIDPNGTSASVGSTPEYWATNSNEPDPRPAHERGTRFLDIDADGKADIIRSYHTQYPTPASTTAIYLNTYSTTTGTYAWTATTTGTSTAPPIVSNSNYDITYRTTGIFADVNADGLPDFAQRIDGVYASTSYIGDGHSWIATTTVFAPARSFPGSSPSPTNSQLADINGDGLPDWIYTENNQTYVSLNHGTGWNANPDPQWTIATTTLFHSSGSYYDRGFRFLDVNGDGLTDAIHGFTSDGTGPESGTYNDTYINTGSGWATTTQYAVGVTTASTVGGIFRYQYNELANFDGNGQQLQDVISSITYPKGGSTSVTYATSSSMLANRELPYSLLVVASLVNHDGFGSNESVTYSYSGGKQYRPWELFDRKFAGFASTTVSTPTTKTTTYYHQHDGVQSSLGEQSDGFALINRPFREDIMSTAGMLLRKTLRKWDTIAHGASTFVAATRELVQDFATDATHRDRGTEWQYSTSTDDLLVATEYGEVDGNSTGVFTDTGSDARATTYTYAASSSINLSLPIEKAVQAAVASFSSAVSATTSVLVVGGGGGGGINSAGGGGGGGVLYDAAHTINATSYSITVGSGGAGKSGGNGRGASGGNSVFDTLTAVGGGAGGGAIAPYTGQEAPITGGSGGGGQYPSVAGASGTSGQGNAGGNASGSGGGGGGGGSGTAGSNASGAVGAAGGNGVTNSITGTSVAYGGGGGGGGNPSGGAGGTGGGGAGGNANGSSGTANTGGGGGAADSGTAGSGGSGVVIISYPTGSLTATGGTITTSGGNTIHSFTSSGTFSVSSISGTTTSSSYTTVAHSKYYYDTLPFGSIGKGNKTRQEDLKSGSLFASTTIGYNSFGLATSTTDRNGNRTTYSYDAYNLYPTTITNPLSQATQYTCNYSNGQVAQTTDPNGRLSKKRYDGVGRVIEVQQSDLTTPATLVSATTFTYTDNSSPPSSVKRSDFLTATTSVDSYTYLDGLGRERQSRVQNNAGSYTASDKTYDSAGRLYQSSLPYFSAGTSYTSPTATSSLLTTFSYDALGRITSQVNAVGTTATTYTKWTQTVTDANSHIKDFIKDAFGNLAQVVEHAASNYTTTYGYDVLGNLASTTDALGNVRTFSYDALSRRTAATDLHAPSDATYGTYSYTYDDNGNLISQTDPKSQTINRAYDALNRITTEDYTGAAGTEVTYTYDSCAYGIGALCTASSTAAKLTQSYDILGRVLAATTTIGGTHYPTAQLFDRQGNITQQNYPTGSRVTYTYGAGGKVSAVTHTDTSNAVTDIAPSITYAPHAAPAVIDFGSGVKTTRIYSESALYRLVNLITTPPEGESMMMMQGGGAGEGSGMMSMALAPAASAPEQKSAATLKGETIATKLAPATTTRSAYTISVMSVEPIKDGVQIFARVWKDGRQVGFGADGTVDIERFRIFNPPLLVEDPKGPIARTFYEINPKNNKPTKVTKYFREDPQEAMLQVLEQNLAAMNLHGPEAIIPGRVGRTTSTFYAGSGNGAVSYEIAGGHTQGNWDTLHDAATGNKVEYAQTSSNNLYSPGRWADSSWVVLARAFYPIDTSAIGADQVITNATLSLYVTDHYSASVPGGAPMAWSLVQGSQASNSSLTTADYDARSTTRLASDIANGSITDNAYNTWTLNADGRAAINKTGTTKLAMLASHDLDDYFTSSTNWVTRLLVRYADYAGTSYDPKLVVEHSTASVGTTTIQNITYAYDPVGNITTITDQGGTDAQHTAAYSYDELDRLLAASTTAASTTPFRLTFSYDALGNITGTRLNGGATTTYSYAGTSYANPHAVTSFGATSYSYDNNGNVTSAGSSSYTWDYLNRITQSVVSGTTTSYGYDHLGSRMFQTVGSTTTRYPSRLFSVSSYVNGATTTATSTEYIYLGDMLLATIDQRAVNGTATGTPTLTYSHPDHLGSTAVMTDAGAAVVQALDYYPYGGARVSSGASTNKRQYIGEFVDGSGLSYLNARYYDSARGQFMGQDPVFWEIGLSRDGKSALMNPQALNSYGYANGNPILNKDPSGRFIPQAMVLGAAYGAATGIAYQAYNDYQTGSLSSVSDYTLSATKGAATGFAAGYSLALGALTAAGTALAGAYLRNDTMTPGDIVSATAEGVVTGVTGGFLKGLPAVRGVQASKLFGGRYVTGAHGQRYAQEAFFSLETDIIYLNVQKLVAASSNQSRSWTAASGGSIPSISQAVVSYASAPGSSYQSQGFISALKAVNDYNNSFVVPPK